MRKYVWLFSLMMFANLISSNESFAQPAGNWGEKIEWSYKVVKIDDSHADIVLTGKLAEHWHVYSMIHDPNTADGTGYPTGITFTKNKNYRLIGKAKDGKKAHVYTDELGTSLIFEGIAVFKQRIEVLAEDAFDVAFEYEFQVCDENGCLFPPAQEATVKVKGFKPASDDEVESKLTIVGDDATDKDGNSYVKYNESWVQVPNGNSIKFYREYLKLGGNYE
ncbi:MAG: hypothetical protein HRT57_00170 [Crocinitomicaceae bacterium]|nr:hypothetical protein [Crocinitomicaceae bacterium]